MSNAPTLQQKEQAKGTISIADLQRHMEDEASRLKQADAPTVDPFPVDVFPAAIQEVVALTAHHLQYRPDWIGASILYAASVAVGNTIGTCYNGWRQMGTLYLAIVGLPGTNKSGPPEFALAPLRQANAEQYRKYKAEREAFSHWLDLSKKERAEEGLPAQMNPPAYKTLLVSDVTPEALALTHQNNPVGLGLFMDELAGWFQNFNRYNKGSEQEFWLGNWSFTPVSIVRKTSGPIQIDRPFISVAGTIQPGLLSTLAKDGRNQNGFVDRILFAFPDDQQKPYDADTGISPDVAEGYRQFLENLLSLRDELSFDDTGAPNTLYLGFTSDAYAELRRWKNANTDRINASENSALKGIYAKMDAYCIRFALLLELMDWACNASDLSAIQPGSVRRAIRLTDYFRQNAEKVHHVLYEQSPAERLTVTQKRLFDSLPDEFNTAEAVGIARKLTIAERTAKKMLAEAKLFDRLRHGVYRKRF